MDQVQRETTVMPQGIENLVQGVSRANDSGKLLNLESNDTGKKSG